ncbi:1588_t:CDS:2, partial [Diversispora eburnea]
MRKEIEEIDLNEPSHEKNEQVCVIQHPAILIIGEAGAGKSTFGNWLLGYHGDNGPFEIGGSNDHVTNICKSRLIKIIKIKNRTYNLIDTPGLFDPNEDVKSDESLNKIADAINHCSYGIQAIVLVIKKDRPFDSQTIKKIKSFLGEPALNHMIVALTYCNLKQTGNKEKLLESLSPKLKSFLDSIGYRYIISPNPDLFPKGHKIVNNNMENAKEFINNFPEAYTTETFNKVRQAREECEKIALLEQENKISQEEIKKLKEQIDEIGRRIAKEEAAKKCFKLDTKVILEGGNLVPMSGITVNDKICVDVINGKLKFSEVYLIAHCDYEDETEFLKVEYISP